jgi:hypothetical protein
MALYCFDLSPSNSLVSHINYFFRYLLLRLSQIASHNVRGAYNKVRVLSGQCRVWTNKFYSVQVLAAVPHALYYLNMDFIDALAKAIKELEGGPGVVIVSHDFREFSFS